MDLHNRNINVLHQAHWNSHQSWFFEKIIKLIDEPYAFRVKIRRNAYDSQSYIHCYILDSKNGWKEIFSLPMTDKLSSFKISYVDRSINPHFMETDADNLFLKAFNLYGVKKSPSLDGYPAPVKRFNS